MKHAPFSPIANFGKGPLILLVNRPCCEVFTLGETPLNNRFTFMCDPNYRK